MRFFTVQDFQHFVVALFLGLIAALLVYLGFRGYRYTQEKKGESKAAEERVIYGEGIEAGDHPIPPLLIFIILGFIIWCIFYVIYFGLKGNAI